MRKTRHGEAVCRCPAYRFPHRFSGGACDGRALVEEHWEATYGGGSCRECRFLDEDYGLRTCQIVEGADRVENCPEWQEYVRVNEIRLLGPRWLAN